jgi:hypothetical protein
MEGEYFRQTEYIEYIAFISTHKILLIQRVS